MNDMTPITPQEIYLLERYSSVEYFGELREIWGRMVAHLENCLEKFMRSLPADYRKRPLPEQPDIVWGERVLPNFRDTLRGLSSGFIMLSHGDMAGLHFAHGPVGDFKGQMDFWSGWMQKEDEDVYRSLLLTSTTMAGNICKTEGAYWRPLTLSKYADQLGPCVLPERWPMYRVNKNVSVASGGRVSISGIYVPDVDDSCAEFLSTRYGEAPLASVLVRMEPRLHPASGKPRGADPVFEERKCVWYFVKRVSDHDIASAPLSSTTANCIRVPAGEACPATGFYFTPARAESRRFFEKGEAMPTFDTDYGAVIWQWDSNQA